MTQLGYEKFFANWDRLQDSERRRRCEALIAKHPDCVPIILSTHRHSTSLKRWRFIMNRDKTVRDLLYHVRLHNKNVLYPAHGIMLVASNTVVNTCDTIGRVYEMFRDKSDFFLYMMILEDDTFGC